MRVPAEVPPVSSAREIAKRMIAQIVAMSSSVIDVPVGSTRTRAQSASVAASGAASAT